MNLKLQHANKIFQASLQITGSKSETNRALILRALYQEITILNVSSSDDSKVLIDALQRTEGTVDVHHAGTAMRFLTAYFAASSGVEVVLTGSERMQQRPIGVLVKALQELGASISYLGKEGFPPLKISGKTLQKSNTNLRADVSSQFISALLLVAPSLPNGLQLTLEGEMTSKPYVAMTLALLQQLKINASIKENTIVIQHKPIVQATTIVIESDWSSASYFYSFVALSEEMKIILKNYKTESLQGDSALMQLYEKLGVTTIMNKKDASITLSKNQNRSLSNFKADLSDTPDIAQTIAVTCFALGLACDLTGLHTLKIKETDRLVALQQELQKLGAEVRISEDSLHLKSATSIVPNISINTYNDHRMAMAFAPLALKTEISILDAQVVTKSFPTFWEVISSLGISISQLEN